jgi:hypothetical protein
MKRKPLYVAALCCLLVIVSAIAGAQNRVLARPSSVGAVTFTPLLPSDMPPVDRRLPKECVVAADGSIVVAESGARSPHSTDDAFDSLDALAMSLLDPLGQAGFIRLSQVQGAFIGRVAYDGGTTGLWSVANTTTTKKFFVETGMGLAGAAPDWETIVGNDIAALSVDWTGQHQFSRTPTSGVLNAWDLWMSSTPYATSLAAMVEMGTNFDGSTSGHYNANSGGQFLGINAPAAWSGDFVNFQNQGNAEFSVGIGGTVVANGLTLSGFGTGIAHVNSSGAFSSSALVASEIPNPAGDVGGTYAATSVNAIRGNAVNSGSAADKQWYVWNSSNSRFELVSMNGAATMDHAGAVSLTSTITAGGPIGNSTTVPVLTWNAAGQLTNVGTATISAGSGTVTSIAIAVPAWLAVAGSPITTSGTITISAASGQTANCVLATPDGTTGAVSVRALVAADIPSLNASKIGSGTLALARGGTNADLSASGSSTSFVAQDASHVISARTIASADLPLNTTSQAGAVSTAPNDTSKFYRGDATWAAVGSTAISGSTNQTVRFSATNTLSASSVLTNDGNTVTVTPTH